MIANTLAFFLAGVFALAGGAKILAVAPMRERAAHVGFSIRAYRLIGVLELAGALGLVAGFKAPILGLMAGSGLLALLLGAIVAHRKAHDSPAQLAPAALLAVTTVAYLILLPGGVQ